MKEPSSRTTATASSPILNAGMIGSGVLQSSSPTRTPGDRTHSMVDARGPASLDVCALLVKEGLQRTDLELA